MDNLNRKSLNLQSENSIVEIRKNDIELINKKLNTDISRLLVYVDINLQASVIDTLLYYVANYSKTYSINIFQSLIHTFSNYPTQMIDKKFVWALHANSLKGNKSYFMNTKCFLKRWYLLCLPGIEPAAYTFISEIRTKGKPAGQVVASMDPVNGPFIDSELLEIVQKSKLAFENKTLDKKIYLLILLLISTGRRISQLLKLKLADLEVCYSNKHISVPRLKQRSNSTDLYRDIEIESELMDQLKSLKEENMQFLLEKALTSDYEINYKSIPLFLNRKLISDCTEFCDLSDFSLTKGQAYYGLSKFVKDHNVVSARTNQLLKVNPNRFRYTFGTELARQGLSIEVISYALDHSSRACAGVYIRNDPKIVEDIDKAVTHYLKDIAGVFMGIIPFSGNVLVKSIMPDSMKENPSNSASHPCEGCKRQIKWR
ncbi:hypothetical protein GCM10009414_30010 [Tatumella terrea]|uniref:site-specific integrase n=1 Tax=Tatumella terrea TaxID=419007 RepID=UPI0031CE5C98